MPYNAIKVANEFLRLAREQGQEVTPLKLLKLVYIANGWSMALLPERLVAEPAQAWQYGPVIPALYRSVRDYRAGAIVNPIPLDFEPGDLDDTAKGLIKAVYDTYGKYTGVQLSNATHQPGTPWSETWRDGAGQNQEIPFDKVKAHYLDLHRIRNGANI